MLKLLQTLRSWAQTIELLDVVVLLALALIFAGTYILWGTGWALLALGSLLLLLVFIGIPIRAKA